VEIHGTVREVVCMACGDRNPAAAAVERLRAGEEDLACLVCGGILKSATISFGQNLIEADLMRSEEAARRCDLLLAIGSTLSVYPAAGVVPLAKRTGARVVIINGGPTEMDAIADALLRGPIGELLNKLLE
jgi:NAD-dependent deacetylase